MKFSANGCPNGVKSSPVTFLHHIIPSITFMIRVVSITNAIILLQLTPGQLLRQKQKYFNKPKKVRYHELQLHRSTAEKTV